jgi:hypothetical protein
MLGLTERAFLITIKVVGLPLGCLYVHLGSVFTCRREQEVCNKSCRNTNEDLKQTLC